MNVSLKPPRIVLSLGDVLRLVDNDDGCTDQWDHKRIVITSVGPEIGTVSLCTLQAGERRSCVLRPDELPEGMIKHTSFVAFAHFTLRNAAELARGVMSGSVPHFGNCGPEVLARIIATAPRDKSTKPKLREALGLPPPHVRRILRASDPK